MEQKRGIQAQRKYLWDLIWLLGGCKDKCDSEEDGGDVDMLDPLGGMYNTGPWWLLLHFNPRPALKIDANSHPPVQRRVQLREHAAELKSHHSQESP